MQYNQRPSHPAHRELNFFLIIFIIALGFFYYLSLIEIQRLNEEIIVLQQEILELKNTIKASKTGPKSMPDFTNAQAALAIYHDFKRHFADVAIVATLAFTFYRSVCFCFDALGRRRASFDFSPMCCSLYVITFISSLNSILGQRYSLENIYEYILESMNNSHYFYFDFIIKYYQNIDVIVSKISSCDLFLFVVI